MRSDANSQPLVAGVREKIAQVDRTLPISGIFSKNDVIASSISQPRLIAQFIGVFAGFAVLLAAIDVWSEGIFGYPGEAGIRYKGRGGC